MADELFELKNRVMKVNLKKKIVGSDGKPMTVKDKEQFICDHVCQVLWQMEDIEGNAATGEQKYRAYKLMQRIAANPTEVEMESEDVTLVKNVALKCFRAGVYGQIVDALEQRD